MLPTPSFESFDRVMFTVLGNGEMKVCKTGLHKNTLCMYLEPKFCVV